MTPHLLLVEDEAPLREATAERLREHGYQVVEADSGEVAQQHLTDFAFDVVVTDLRLPGIDGTAVVQAAREHYPEIVTVVVTGYGTVEDAVAAIKQGANEFITKPFQFDHLGRPRSPLLGGLRDDCRGAGSRIRTSVAHRAPDLQSGGFIHSPIPALLTA